jgi:hypothetical protein
MNDETDKESLSDSTSSSDVSTSLWLSVNVLSSDSTAASDVSLSSGVSGLSSGVNWTSGGVGLSGSVDWTSGGVSGSSLNETALDETALDETALNSSGSALSGISGVSAFNWVSTLKIGSATLNVIGVGGGHTLLVAWRVSSLDVAGLDVLALPSDVVVSFRVVDDLSFNWQVLNSFPDSFNWFVFNDSFFNFLGNVFDLGFNSVVVSDGSFDGDSFSSGNFFVFDDFSFVWNSFNSFDLIVFNVFLFEWNVFDSRFDWDFFSDDLLGKALADSRVTASWCLESLVDQLVVLGNWAVSGLSAIDDTWTLSVGLSVGRATDDLSALNVSGGDGSVVTGELVVDAFEGLSNLWHRYLN